MNAILKKIFLQYIYIILYICTLFIVGFTLTIILKFLGYNPILIISRFYNNIITLNDLLSYLYYIIFLGGFIVLLGFHSFGVLLIGLIAFLLGIHNANYSLLIVTLPFWKLLFEIIFLLFQSIGLIVLMIGSLELSINVYATTFILNERLKYSDILHHLLNFSFIAYVLLFVSIIFKIYFS